MASKSSNNDQSYGVSTPTLTSTDGSGDDPPTLGCPIDTGGAIEISASRTSDTSAAAATTAATTTVVPDPESQSQPSGLSKNRKKKLEKRERARQKKLERKAAEKAKRLATAIAQGRDIAAEKKFVEERTLSGDRRRRLDEIWDSKRKEARTEERFEICVDMGARRRHCDNGDEIRGAGDGRIIRAIFEEAMREREVASLAQQIRYCYAYNKKSPNPVLTAVTGLSRKRETPTRDDDDACGSGFPTVRELLERETGFPEWNRRMFDCTERTLEDYYGFSSTTIDDTVGENHPERALESPSTSSVPQQKIVYLTSDSQTTLECLENNAVYVIGGIVDRNRLKRATIDRAENELNVETAKLPLQEYLLANNISMSTTKVLTVNHVFDILLKYRQHGNDWNKAFKDVLPSRKV
jgi:tRNA (guanine9-N1)-methyltransferase